MAPIYEYEAISRGGERVAGRIEADRSNIAAKQLKESGYYVTSIKEVQEKKDLGSVLKASGRVKTKDLTIFSHQFAAMFDAGISLVDALNILYEEAEHPKLKEVIREIQEDIETGSSLSDAMSRHPKVFPELYCQLVRAGETGGVLNTVLNQLAAHYDKQEEINGKVKSALYYPITILVIAVFVVIFLVVKIVPTFVGMFNSFGAALPLPTRILLGASDFLQTYWWALLLGIGGLLAIFYSYRQTSSGELQLDKLILKIPVIGNMMQKVILSRFSSTLAILLGSGVDLISSLNIVEDVVGNKVYANALVEARGQVREGVSFSRPLANMPIFPSILVQMVKIGEESGNLEMMLNKVSNFYDREVGNAVEASISLIEPLMIVFLAGVVGFIVISIVLPMFEMFQQF
ncbi:MAG TPA: type II secretion system F family protein [Halanaerobiales bacterium]|nr:type II secretion system F family protein [Halanaerobiales bacterium]HPZ63447.1 type II secretion system F family protein [Halanaerobiales bacterium]HQD04684.1 type II secretion system F family protein [Halanaerobiales bacterium]